MSFQGSGVVPGSDAMVLEREPAMELQSVAAEHGAELGASPTAGGLVQSLIERRTRPTPSVEAKSIAGALALAAIYGLPLGARGGVASMLEHAVGVVLGLAAVAGFAAPAF